MEAHHMILQGNTKVVHDHLKKTGNGLTMGEIAQCIKCPSSDVNRLANAIKKHVERKHPTCMVRSMQDYGDGLGRVWMLPRPEKVKA